MAYQKQSFTDGVTVLQADHLKHIEDGIVANESAIGKKQDALVSGQNIKTINGQSIIGEGNIEISGGTESGGAETAILKGKKVSFVGDSITTYTGSLPSKYASWYPKGDITSVEMTWWKQFLLSTGADLLVNASWSACQVSGNQADTSGNIACSQKRVDDLSANGETPDVVIIFVGINDFLRNEPIGSWDGTKAPVSGDTFSEAYALLVARVFNKYPAAEVFCCSLIENKSSGLDRENGFPNANTNGDTIDDFNSAIRVIARKFGANFIDIHACGISIFNSSNFTIDGTHPNSNGAKLIASKAVSSVKANTNFASGVLDSTFELTGKDFPFETVTGGGGSSGGDDGEDTPDPPIEEPDEDLPTTDTPVDDSGATWYQNISENAKTSIVQKRYGAFTYSTQSVIAAMQNVPINLIRFVPGGVGTISYGKVNTNDLDATPTWIGSITITDQAVGNEAKAYKIQEITLSSEETICFVKYDTDTGAFKYNGNNVPGGDYHFQVGRGDGKTSESTGCLCIDIGYIPQD